MSINHIGHTPLSKDTIYRSDGTVKMHDDKISHAHKVQTNAPVPPVEKADFLQPTPTKKPGQLIDIKV